MTQCYILRDAFGHPEAKREKKFDDYEYSIGHVYSSNPALLG